jgi:hypothetical protein
MILGGNDRGAVSDRTTLDDLFRRAGVRNPDALALADPPNRESFTCDAPRRLTFAQADRAISAFAARLRRLGLPTDAVVAMQLPNTVESPIALLGVLRAGMIAAPLPLLWRKQEIVAALKTIGAKAIVTTARIESCAHAELAIHVAAELFTVRHVCAFGDNLPDGVSPLDDVFAPAAGDFVQASPRPGNAAAHVAVVTFDVAPDGQRAIARNHLELIAGGRGPSLECGADLDAMTISTIPIGSFAGMALALVPWLLGGGSLHLHHGFDLATFATQSRALEGGTIVLPGPALAALVASDCLETPSNIIALWRSPERTANQVPRQAKANLIDAASFGEIGIITALRGPDGLPVPMPYGSITAPRGAAGAPIIIEALRGAAGALMLRGPMVPSHAFPPGAERGSEPHLSVDAMGFVDTGYKCRLTQHDQTLAIDGPPPGITSVGGYRFRQNDIDWMVTEADLDAVILALPDAMLDWRLAGNAEDRAVTAASLAARGANALIAGAFRPRALPDAA